MTLKLLGDAPTGVKSADADMIALVLRLGLGSIFIIGGWWKLSRALDPDRAAGLVARYMADNGYINAFFEQYLFAAPDALLTPLGFLIVLSAFELLSGVALVCGLFVRALSFIYAFLLWTFVIALPVVTSPGAELNAASHFSPALLVQIRDVGLSGIFFVLLNMGSGAFSLDRRLFNRGAPPSHMNWNAYGLLLRLSVASVFIVGGFFAGYDHIKSFIDAPIVLIGVGLLLASGYGARIAATAALAIIAWYSIGKLNADASLWGNLNAIKREIGYLAALGVLAIYQGGRAFRPGALAASPMNAFIGKPLAA
ncbi:MAG: DoxX family protein [Pseudomonadota bacterium]